MSGHSKWSTIKRKKGAEDAKRANIFTKVAKNLTIAAKEGPDPDMNFKLKVAIDQARAVNMPKDNIQRAIDRASGKSGEGQLEQIVYEAFGPAGTALLIEAATDNKNRTVSDIKTILTKNGGSMGGPNSVNWMFNRKGTIRLAKEDNSNINFEEFQLAAIEAGAADIEEEKEGITIYTQPTDLMKVKGEIEKQKVSISNAEIEMIAKDIVNLSDKDKPKLENLLESLDENEDVTNYYTNANI